MSKKSGTNPLSQLKPNEDDTIDLDHIPDTRKIEEEYDEYELDPVQSSTNPNLRKEFHHVWVCAFNSAVATIPGSKGLATAANVPRAKELAKELSFCRIFANQVLADYMDNYEEKNTIIEGFFMTEEDQ